MFFSIEVNYRMENFFWGEEIGKPVSREEIIIK